jgi:hypothetical protein
MRVPSFAALQRQTTHDGLCHSFSSRMHPDPRLYKYSWWVFWRSSPCEGWEFLARKHALCTADAMALTGALAAANEPHWLYNLKTPRFEAGVTPFDHHSSKWHDVTFAAALHEDSDANWRGYK